MKRNVILLKLKFYALKKGRKVKGNYQILLLFHEKQHFSELKIKNCLYPLCKTEYGVDCIDETVLNT